MTEKTIRDLELLLRKVFGFSSRRSKVGAAVAWKALTGSEALRDTEFRDFAHHCHNLSHTTQSPELAAKLQDYADECNQRADELAAQAAAISTSPE